MRTTDSLQQAEIGKNVAKTQNRHMRTSQQSQVMEEVQLLQTETRRMCCLDSQSESFKLSSTKTGAGGRREDGKADTFKL